MRSFVTAVLVALAAALAPIDLPAQIRGAYENAPDLGYTAVTDPLSIPEGTILGNSSSVAVDAAGHLYVFHRGMNPLTEFDRTGQFVRSFGGEHGFGRPHGMRIDSDGYIWVTDVNQHFVAKLNRRGNILMTIGIPGRAGKWDEASGARFLNEPNDIAFGPAGEIFVAQGHGNGDPRVLKFDKVGKFLTSWGGQGTGVGEFDIPHSIVVDSRSWVHVADRENHRIQVFDLDGNPIRQSNYAGLPCGLIVSGDDLYMVSGHSGQIVKIDEDGHVVAATGESGEGIGRFGEAHYLAIGPMNEIFVADPVTGEVEKFVPR